MLISGIVTSCNEKWVLSIMFHLIFTFKYGCQPFFKFAINLIPGATCIACNGDELTLSPLPLSCAKLCINEYDNRMLGCIMNLPCLNSKLYPVLLAIPVINIGIFSLPKSVLACATFAPALSVRPVKKFLFHLVCFFFSIDNSFCYNTFC